MLIEIHIFLELLQINKIILYSFFQCEFKGKKSNCSREFLKVFIILNNRSPKLRSFEQLIDVWFNSVWVELVLIILNNLAIFIKQEFREIPFDVSSLQRWVVSQVLVACESLITVNVTFLKYREQNIVFGYKLKDFIWWTRLLLSELVAWERQNLKAFAGIFRVHLN